MQKMTRRNFWVFPGAVIAAATVKKPLFGCTVSATCLSHTDTSVTLQVTASSICTPLPDTIRVEYQALPAGAFTTTNFAMSQSPTNVTVSGLTCGVEYLFRVTLIVTSGGFFSNTIEVRCSTECPPPPPPGGCTRTQGYWKNHEEAWPVQSLVLGTNGQTYSKAQLLNILGTPVRGNGLISLAHQLIAAKLNVAAGAGCAAAASIISQADAKIGSLIVGTHSLPTSETSTLVGQLDDYNNGRLAGCALHCEG